MGLQFTVEQVIALAPDTSSASAGKKQASAKLWQNLGQSSEALWGECQGSALYQVKIDLSTFAVQCSCPSRKLPCKHSLGLLLLAVTIPDTVPVTEPPEWVTTWLAKRATTNKRKETQKQEKADAAPSSSQIKTAEKRLAQVKAGIEQLDLWLNDLVRNGLGVLETQPATFWEAQAAKMEDAKAPGIALRVRRLAAIPNSAPDWPERLLWQLGQLALLTQAFRNIERLEPGLQEDVRQLIGWNLKEEEVIERGEHVSDEWLMLGQSLEERDRGRVQHTWLLGTASKRSAHIMQFSIGRTAFPEQYLPGSRQQAELVYWPSLQPDRALIHKRGREICPIQSTLPGHASIAAFFDDVATVLAKMPWRDRFLCTLNNVVPIYHAAHNPHKSYCSIRDQSGQALPLVCGEHWQLLALSGGQPLDLAAEWNGSALQPLGFLLDQRYYLL